METHAGDEPPQPLSEGPNRMHTDLERAVADLDLAAAGFEALTRALTPTEFNWRAAADRWSIGQCLDHVTTTNTRMVPLIERAIERAGTSRITALGAFQYGLIARWFLGSTGPGGARMRAPALYRPSLSDLEPAEVLDRYRTTSARLRNAACAADGLDLRRIRVPSAALQVLRLPLGIWLLSLSAHELRHLNQARAVRSSPQFGSNT